MDRTELLQKRRQWFAEMEKSFLQNQKKEDSIFYYHSSEDRIVLSHALFWVMSKSYIKILSNNKCFLLLRQYQEEMLTAYLTLSDEYEELLRYCNCLYEALPYALNIDKQNPLKRKSAKKLSYVGIVASGYGGDMPEELACELLDDMDFFHNKLCCRKIEALLPTFNDMVEDMLIKDDINFFDI